MKVYHGSSSRHIKKFNFRHSRKTLDYGRGIYFTTNFDQAKEWSCKYRSVGAVYECEIELDHFKLLTLHSKKEDLIYLLYLCRIGLEDIAKESIDSFEEADIVYGLMLDGKMDEFSEFAEQFNDGSISYEEFSEKVKLFRYPYNQLCIKSKKALEQINAVIKQVYYTKKQQRKIKVTSKKHFNEIY